MPDDTLTKQWDYEVILFLTKIRAIETALGF